MVLVELLIEKRDKEKRFSTEIRFIGKLKPAASLCINMDSM